MQQAVVVSPGRIEFREVPIAEPGPGQVLIRMKRIGVCGSNHSVINRVHYP